MNDRPFPARPRLADHVLARRYHGDGEELVILHDTERGGLVRLGPREWGLLACADGTRDVVGILRAAARHGAHARADALRSFLEQLHAAGLLADDAADRDDDERDPPGEGDGARASNAVVADRPLEPLPDFALSCDGSGSCCRIYSTVLFSTAETARARAALPLVLDAASLPQRAFSSERGSVDRGAWAVTLVDGRCGYLGERGRCGIHAAAGAAEKPFGCRLYPASFTDDGESVRVSVAPECACVLASVGRAGGEPLVVPAARVRGDLDPAVHVGSLPERIPVARGEDVPRSEYVAWSRACAEHMAAMERSAVSIDVAAHLWGLAADVESEGLRGGAAARGPAPAPDSSSAGATARLRAEALPWIEALAQTAAKRARDDEAWRGERDLARMATRWTLSAARSLLAEGAEGEALPRAPDGRLEAFYVRALLHGHALSAGRPLAAALRDRAVRLVVARALPLALARVGGSLAGAGRDEPVDPAAAYPLALVEALLRAHGLASYADDLAR